MMEVYIYNEADLSGRSRRPLAVWPAATEVPATNDYIELGRGANKKTWIVHRRVWRPGGTRVDVFCGGWDFNF